ncbi:MAG: glycosyltransferase, partial [Candidatus Paceibacterota bacterium]
MKVLHINSSDILGGAARAAYRIHKGLLGHGISSKMLVQNKKSNEPKIETPYSTKTKKIISILRPYVNSMVQKLQHKGNPIYHSSNILPSGLHKMINSSEADIVHLHWINAEMISIREISKINKPIIWTLHDMWAFSGAEHIDDWDNPGRYKYGYSKKNRPDMYSGIDIDRWTWKRKKKYWDDLNINFVTPSNWLATCYGQSALFKNKEADVIPNGLDTTVFKATKKQLARQILNLPDKKKIVLYGAFSAESNPIKGYQKMIEAKKILYNNKSMQDAFYLVFGNDYPKTEQMDSFTTQYLGRIDDNITLSLVYSAADVMVVPSIMEAFGQT